LKNDTNNPFDESIRQSLEGFEMPYDPAAWTALESQLPPAGSGAASSLRWKSIMGVAIVAVGLIAAFVLTNETQPNEQVQNSEVITPSEEQFVSERVVVEQPVVQAAQETDAGQEATDNVTETKTNDLTQQNSSSEQPSTIEPSVKTTTQTPAEKNVSEQKPIENTEGSSIASEEPFKAKFITSAMTVCAGEAVSFINESSDRILVMVRSIQM